MLWLFCFVQWQQWQRAGRCRYNSSGSRLSFPRTSVASISSHTGTHVASPGSGSPCSDRGRRLLLHSEQQLCPQPRAYVTLSKWPTSYIKWSTCNIYGHTPILNNMYICQKSQEFSNQVPTRNQSAHSNTYQHELRFQQRAYIHIIWRNYISSKQHCRENKINSKLDQYIY